MPELLVCDFCGMPMEWSPEQQRLDVSLRLMGSGLGAMCDHCGDLDVEHAREEMEREDNRLRWEEFGGQFYRDHPHG